MTSKKKGKRRRPQANSVTIEQGAGSLSVNNTQPCSYPLTDSNLEDPLVFLPVRINDLIYQALVDSGASWNFISRKVVDENGLTTWTVGQKTL